MAFSHGTPNSIVTDGLVFCVDPANVLSYPRTGATVTDIVGDTTGTLSGAGGGNNTPQWENTNGGIFDFDGTDDYIDMGTNLFTSNPIPIISISTWIKTSNTSAQVVVSKDGGSGLKDFQMQISGEDFYWQTSVNGTGYSNLQLTNSEFDLLDDQWHNIIVTSHAGPSSGDGEKKIYVDGQLQKTDSSATINNIFNTTGQEINIGRKGDVSRHWNGKISLVQIYNSSLSASEVLQNYNALKNRFRT